MQTQKLTFADLKTHLLSAADILRKSLNASENSKPVLTLLFLKRLNDVFEENAERKMKEQNLHLTFGKNMKNLTSKYDNLRSKR